MATGILSFALLAIGMMFLETVASFVVTPTVLVSRSSEISFRKLPTLWSTTSNSAGTYLEASVSSKNDSHFDAPQTRTFNPPKMLIQNLPGPQKFFEMVEENYQANDDDRILVVMFHAHYCQTCKRAGLQYQKLAKKLASDSNEDQTTIFTNLESSTCLSADQLRAMGVTKFPFVQIFRKGDCVASFGTGPVHLFARKVEGSLEACRARSPDDWENFFNQFGADMAENQQGRQNVKEVLLLSQG